MKIKKEIIHTRRPFSIVKKAVVKLGFVEKVRS